MKYGKRGKGRDLHVTLARNVSWRAYLLNSCRMFSGYCSNTFKDCNVTDQQEKTDHKKQRWTGRGINEGEKKRNIIISAASNGDLDQAICVFLTTTCPTNCYILYTMYEYSSWNGLYGVAIYGIVKSMKLQPNMTFSDHFMFSLNKKLNLTRPKS